MNKILNPGLEMGIIGTLRSTNVEKLQHMTSSVLSIVKAYRRARENLEGVKNLALEELAQMNGDNASRQQEGRPHRFESVDLQVITNFSLEIQTVLDGWPEPDA